MKIYSKLQPVVIVLALIALAVILAASQPAHAAGPWYVAPDGDDGNDCLSAGAACATINGTLAKASPGDTIYVAIGTYTGTGDEVALLDKDITLSGGWDSTFATQNGTSTIDGEGSRRGITVNSGVIVVIEHFTVQGGSSDDGGGIFNDGGTVTLHNSTISGNTANNDGGGIRSDNGTLTLTNSTISNNTANQCGGIYANNYYGGSITLHNSTVSGNTNGGIHSNSTPILVLTGSDVSGNTGNGIYASDGTVTISNSTFSDNADFGIVNGDASVMTLNSCTVSGNMGGGISNGGDSLTLYDSIVSGNTAERGGGIDNGGTLTLNSSTVSGNTATDTGGGIFSGGDTVNLNNSTISDNTAKDGGGIASNRSYDILTLNSSTVSGNTATDTGGGIFSIGTVTLQNSVLAGNTASSAPDCSGTIDSADYSLVGNTSGCNLSPGTGVLTNVNAALGTFIGSPGYYPLLASSPAIDAGNPTGCTDHLGDPLDTDQRGVARVGRCDMGAYEYTIPGPAASIHAIGGTPQHGLPLSVYETPLQALVLDSIGSPVSSTVVTFFAPESGPSGTFADGGTIVMPIVTGESGIATAPTFTANALEGNYTVTATVSGVVTPAHFLLGNILWRVAPDGDDGNDCQTPATPCATINGALGKTDFVAGDTVLVASGTYTGTSDEVVLLNKNARLLGGWEWDGTLVMQSGLPIINGEGVRRGIKVNSGVTALIERFVVQNGYDSPSFGAGVSNDGTLTLNNSRISGDTAECSAVANTGIFTANNSTISGNVSRGTGCEAPAVMNQDAGVMTLNNTIVNDNKPGGGFYNLGTLTLNNSTISRNTAETGGGIHNYGNLALNNSTLSGNRASISGGGIHNGHENTPATLTLNNSTVSGNTVTYYYGDGGGGIYNENGTVTMQNTILVGNTTFGAGTDCYGMIDSSGYNLVGDTSGCIFISTSGDLINIDTRLGPLLGTPAYHFLFSDSPAIDAGNPAGCTDHLGNLLTTDQRGTLRPLDGDGNGSAICDIGAYEFDPANPPRQVFLPIVVRNYCPLLYTDDFSDPGSGWPISDDGDIRYEYLDGEYRILVRNTNRWAGAAPGFKASDYVVAVDVRNATGVYGSYGLIFGLSDDWSQLYSFEIDPDGHYGIMRYSSGTWTNLASATSGSINTGTATNRLKIERNGSLIRAYVNGQLLTSVSDSTYGGSRRIGLIVSAYDLSNVDVRFDDFTVYPVGCGAGASAFSQVNKATGGGAEEINLSSKWIRVLRNH